MRLIYMKVAFYFMGVLLHCKYKLMVITHELCAAKLIMQELIVYFNLNE